jgi:hypothetical protein
MRFCAQWTVPRMGKIQVQQAGRRIAPRRAPHMLLPAIKQSSLRCSVPKYIMQEVTYNVMCNSLHLSCSQLSSGLCIIVVGTSNICSCSPIAASQRYACSMLARLLVQSTQPRLINQCNVCVCCSRPTLGSHQRRLKCRSEAMRPCRLGIRTDARYGTALPSHLTKRRASGPIKGKWPKTLTCRVE